MIRRTFLSLLATLPACAAKVSLPASSSSSSSSSPPSPSSSSSPSPSSSSTPDPFHDLGADPPPAPTVRILEWSFPRHLGQERRAVALVPAPLADDAKVPLVIALHGWGEAVDATIGARGWPEAYELVAAMTRLRGGPLIGYDFQGFVTPARLAELNAERARRPFEGVAVVCPFVPREIGTGVSFSEYARWIADVLLPKARAELPIRGDAQSTGIDGVSMGGRAALRVGMLKRALFGAIGALQPQVDTSTEALDLARDLARDLHGRPLRIVTSTDDIYRVPLLTLDAALTKLGVAHEFFMGEGPHDYPWNRGPGAIEMLMWHDRILRREEAS